MAFYGRRTSKSAKILNELDEGFRVSVRVPARSFQFGNAVVSTFVPSHFVDFVVPGVVKSRLGERYEKALRKGDAIWRGDDEEALSARNAMFAFSIRIASAFIAYLSQVLMARWLGVYEFGVFVWVWTAALLIGSLACIGLSTAILRFIPEYRTSGDAPALRGVIFGSLWARSRFLAKACIRRMSCRCSLRSFVCR